MSAGATGHELIAKAIGGDRGALEELLLVHSAGLSRYIAPRLPLSLHGVIGVEDILQQTFVQAFRDIGKLRQTSEQSFVAWLRAIAEHRLQDALKGLRRKKRGGGRRPLQTASVGRIGSIVDLVELLSDRHDTPARSAARREAIHAVQIGLANLPDDQREAIRQHILEGHSLLETATSMDRTPGAVRALIYRGKQRLREAMGRASWWSSRR
jgi:RNA polymerase sigma-70 factor (ECF subfamily)